jgi:hypothetical protein
MDGGMSSNPHPPLIERQCLWCHTSFVVRTGPGRKRLYCRVSCRQRAYERRTGLGVLPPPERLIMRPGGPLAHLPNRVPAYEAGGRVHEGGKIHALRPADMAGPGEKRATLCGIRRSPNGRLFVPSDAPHVCRTCARVADLRPAARAVRPSSDLAAYRAQLDAIAVRLGHHGVAAAMHDPEIATRLLLELLSAA